MRGAERLLLDTSGGRHPGGTGVRADRRGRGRRARRPGRPRRWPGARQCRQALRDIAAVGVDVARVSRRLADGERPRQGPVQGGPVREARQGGARRSPEPAGQADAGPAGLLEADASRPLGHGPRLRRPIRARDAHGGARPARDRVRRAPPRPGLLGGAPGAAGPVRRPPDALYRADRLAAGSLATRATRRPGPAGARPRADLRLYLKREDLAHTGPTRSTTRLARRCSPDASANRG